MTFRNKRVLSVWIFAGIFLFCGSSTLWAGNAKKLIDEVCSSCHKFAGQYESKFNLKAPDLMWGGQKYQRDWLLLYLEGKADGPGASGLEPKPAVHAELPLSDYPEDYLYNIVVLRRQKRRQIAQYARLGFDPAAAGSCGRHCLPAQNI